MKKKLGAIEMLCYGFTLVISIQLVLLLIVGRTSSLTNRGQENFMATKNCNSSTTISTAYIQSSDPIICDRSQHNYDWCTLNRPTILLPNTSTFYTVGSRSQNSINPQSTEKVRPYPRKWEKNIMSHISEITLTTSSIDHACDIYHEAPALVFSVSGYTGNYFHEFNDGIIPLYITMNTLFANQDVTLVVANFTDWWYSKYEVLLNAFTRHRVVNFENQTLTHCFPSVTVGLISHGIMSMVPNDLCKNSSFIEFRSLLELAYSKCPIVTPLPQLSNKPRVVFMSRTGDVSRVILNQNETIEVVKKAGFEVTMFQPTRFTNLCDAYRLINGSHGIIGVHGAALTHSLFLRPGSVLLQIVPLANDKLADSCFKNLAMGMSLEYVEYKIVAKESSLVETYGLNHIIVRNPQNITRGNWSAVDSIYLKGQNVTLDLDRLWKYLVLGYSKAKRFMEESG